MTWVDQIPLEAALRQIESELNFYRGSDHLCHLSPGVVQVLVNALRAKSFVPKPSQSGEELYAIYQDAFLTDTDSGAHVRALKAVARHVEAPLLVRISKATEALEMSRGVFQDIADRLKLYGPVEMWARNALGAVSNVIQSQESSYDAE